MSKVSFDVAISSDQGIALSDELKEMGGEYLASVSSSSKRDYWILPGDNVTLRQIENCQLSFDWAVRFYWDRALVDELKATGARYFVAGSRSNRRKFWIVSRDKEADARAAALRLLGTDGEVTDFVDVVLVVEVNARIATSDWYLNFAYLPLLRASSNGDAKPFDEVELINGRALSTTRRSGASELAYEAPTERLGYIRIRNVARARALGLRADIHCDRIPGPVRDMVVLSADEEFDAFVCGPFR